MKGLRRDSKKMYLSMAVTVLIISLLASVLCFGSLSSSSTDNRPVEAATTNATYTYSRTPSAGTRKDAILNVRLYYDNTYVSASIPSGYMRYEDHSTWVGIYWSYNFTVTPKSGYSWNSSFTNFVVKYKSIDDKRSSSDDVNYYQTLWSNIQAGSYSTIIFTRSGNTFTASGEHYADADPTESYPSYCFWVGYIEFDVSSKVLSPKYDSVITFNSNGGSSCSQTVAKSGSSYTTLPTPTKSGNTFMGWFTDSGLTGSPVTTSTVVTSSHTLYAKWQASYQITFVSNGGSECASQIGVADSGYTKVTYGTLPTPTKSGYTLMGWFTSSSLSGSPVTTSTTVTSSHTLYAKWQASCQITFVSNGGSDCTSQLAVPNNTGANLIYGTIPTPTKDGYTFYGWYKTSNFTSAKVQATDTVTNSHTLYARWGVIINFNQQGGQGTDSILTPYNEPMLSFSAPTMTGFTFAGYFTQPLGKSVQYYNSGMQSAHSCDLVQNTTLYACWQSTLNLDLQGGTGDTSVIAIYNDNMPEIIKPIRSGYTFGGYFTAKNGTGTRYYTNSMSSSHLNDLPNGTTLYAYWMINTYILYYNPNGGTVSSTEASVTFGSTVTPPTPTRTGYTFFGWYIGDERYSGGIWTFTENKTATAKWGYTLTYNANGGWVTPGSVTLTDGDVITTPIPTRRGCDFDGWKIGSSVYYGGLWAYTANQTATAQWVCKLSASLNNGAEGTISGTTNGYYSAGTSFSITASPTSGYAFDYWIINDTKVTTATYSGTLNEHTTAVAYFTKTQPTANVYSTNGTIASTYLNIEPDTYSATLRISPETGKYIESISFDNVAYYTIDSWSTTLYASSSFAQNVAYRANEGNNDLWLTFNFYNTNKTVNVYVNLTTTPYSNLNVPRNTGGALDGIAVSANYGGSVTLVGADYETLADSDEIICTAKLAQEGYEFVGWVFADSQSNILSTEESAKFTKATIYGRQLMAKFQPTADNPDYNMELNN